MEYISFCRRRKTMNITKIFDEVKERFYEDKKGEKEIDKLRHEFLENLSNEFYEYMKERITEYKINEAIRDNFERCLKKNNLSDEALKSFTIPLKIDNYLFLEYRREICEGKFISDYLDLKFVIEYAARKFANENNCEFEYLYDWISFLDYMKNCDYFSGMNNYTLGFIFSVK
jgi:hypothetical protein